MSSPDPFTHALRERIDALTAKERAIFGEATSEDIRDVMARRSNLKVHLQPGERVHHLRRYGELLASLLDFLDTVEGRGDPGRRMRQPEVVNNGYI
ncbi:hypothetical protein FA95DRAFT_1161666 [Auriscalpium vulgare]|uniref:Uncharacterized protein n=1 Tax=Auriscalpium vulgare TaxID=40419 RepID=A0ACB8S9A5_9AGAM|nr:hypothetical protein FA95DRAFT_1161666 [Auriscalpium vulgare]